MNRLLFGDCLDVWREQSLPKVDCVIADPPYEVLNKKAGWDNIIDIDQMWEMLFAMCKDTTPIVLFSQEPYTSKLIQSQQKLFKYKLYWHKTAPTGFLNAKKQPLRNIEEILVFYKKQCTYNPQKTTGHKPVNSYRKTVVTANHTDCYGETSKEVVGGGNTDRYPTQLLTFKSDKQTSSLHPTEKPLELITWLVKTFSNEGDVVYDFCMGSGTTGVAAISNGRNFIGIEKEKKYFDIAETRIKQYL